MIQKNTTYRNSASLQPAGGVVCQLRGLLVRRLCQGLCCRRQSVSQSMHAYFQSMSRIQNLHLFISPTYVYFQSTFRTWHSLLTRPVASTATVVTGTARLYVCMFCVLYNLAVSWMLAACWPFIGPDRQHYGCLPSCGAAYQ